ncbi:ribonuclease P protein component [Psychrosphaera saromensis]|uniref:Ribonuclease P protein component n=1 Tax=Psychrosphaera saromensis TaxID=716813 RepID=A0A2S7USA9_9GAMM|nr:ribonuclease P protein component [Psychrosphaera saromensis]PQJ52833.1 ribonuclease P protein component [Psychrosphaera saromensis]GHB71620.1 ribonuclease P protein component [Psychrosphaera saromensis]GLQ13337.1 ribonuclease P protein component [Psychrosphaera saromensis]
MKSNTFPRELRLVTPSQFSRVFDHPVKAVSDHITILAKFNDLENPRIGLTIAKKKEKTAVGRNRIKRIIRDSFRLNQHNLPNIDIVVIARNQIGEADNKHLHKQLNKLWKKITLRCEQSLKQ